MRRLLAALAIIALPLTAGAAEQPVRIGVLTDMNGLYADIAGPGSVAAALMAVDDFGGTVLGRRIEVEVGDHQNKPDLGSEIARRWYDRDGVGLIVDAVTSSVLLAVNEVARSHHKLLIATSGGTSSLTGPHCAPETFQWVYDTYGLAAGTATTIARRGGKDWAFVTADYEFGRALEADASAAVLAAGGRILGSFRHPLEATDFASQLVSARNSGAQVVGFASGGADAINAIHQASEFGIGQTGTNSGGQQMAGLFLNISDVNALGLKVAHGLLLTQAFYWDQTDETRAFSRRFFARQHAMPSMGQAGTYSAVMAWLKAVQAAGTDDSVKVAEQMRAMPVNDFMVHGARIRADGKLIHDLYLYQVKEPSEQKEPWDYLKLVATVPADVANRPLAEGGCPLVK